jgi:hypothetical protein
MSAVLTPKATEQGWVIDMPEEMAKSIGVEEGSTILLYGSEGGVRTEILPPLSPQLQEASRYLLKKNRALYDELKRIGD